MSLADLERDFEFAQELEKHYKIWHTGAAELRRKVRPKRLNGKVKSAGGRSDTAELATDLTPFARALGVELSAVLDGRHQLYLALSGALLTRGMSADVLPSFVASVAEFAGDIKIGARTSDAISSIRARERGMPLIGYMTLKRSWPAIAHVIDAHRPGIPSLLQQRVERELASNVQVPLVSLEDAVRSVNQPATGKGTFRLRSCPLASGRHAPR
jgi:hypothetical protein